VADGKTGPSYEISDQYKSMTNSRKYLRKGKGETDNLRSPSDTYAVATDHTKRVKSAAHAGGRKRVKPDSSSYNILKLKYDRQ